ncbi:MAG: FHA domain-containing protein, partial [Candidatus Accumulibacter sp.]|nr:FHA domain-containing protein [Accumulibacter sp.]
MLTNRVILKTPDGDLEERVFDASVVSIGKDDGCDIVIRGWSIGKRHAEIRFTPEGARIVSQNTLMGVGINGERVKEYGPLLSKDEIQLGNYSLYVIPAADGAPTTRPPGDGGGGRTRAGAPPPSRA